MVEVLPPNSDVQYSCGCALFTWSFKIHIQEKLFLVFITSFSSSFNFLYIFRTSVHVIYRCYSPKEDLNFTFKKCAPHVFWELMERSLHFFIVTLKTELKILFLKTISLLKCTGFFVLFLFCPQNKITEILKGRGELS